MTRWKPKTKIIAISDIPLVHCKACGRPLPRLLYQPFNENMEVRWSEMMVIERQVIAGMVLWHVKGNEYSTWSCDSASELCGLSYRQVQNSLRRLVPCRWVERVSRGRYRLTDLSVTTLRPEITSARMRLTALRDAQVKP